MLRRICFGILIIVCLTTALAWGQESAAQVEARPVPRLIRFSGVVRQTGEKPARSVAELSFSLFREESGGEPLWFETQTVELDAHGRYNVLLGAMHADGLPIDLFTSGEARWLSIMVGKAEQPRVLLVSVPYALKAGDAELLGGKPAAAYVAADELKEQVANAMSDPNTGLRTLNSVVLAPGGGTPPPAIVETSPSTFTCTSAGNCVTVTQNGAGPAILAVASGTTGVLQGVRGQTASTSGRGVYGLATATTGVNAGVRGDSASTTGYGVLGNATAPTGLNYGLVGVAASTGGVGLAGRATSPTGATIGLRGIVDSRGGSAAALENRVGGKIISGVGTGGGEKFVVDGNGNLTATGTVTGASFVGSGSGLTGVGDILGITTAAGSGLQGGATTGTPSLGLLTSCGGSQVLKFISSTWQCADDNITVSPSALTRGIVYLAGCDTCTALADTDDQQDFYVNVIGALKILSVACYTDGGSPSINMKRDDGSAANILTGNLSCTGATGTIDTNEDDIAVGEKLDFVLVSAGGAKRITLVIKATL